MQLGRSEVSVSRVVLGCMWSAALSEAEIARIVHAAFEAGVTSFDTAPLYGFHSGEHRLGRALRDRRGRVQILSKAGLRWDDTHGAVLFEFRDDAGRLRKVRKDSRPEQLAREVEASLLRLGVDQLDLLQIHHPDRQTPLEDSLGALLRLKEQGKIRAIGVSNVSPEELTKAAIYLGEGGLASLQTEYSLLHLLPERALLPICRARHVSLLAYSPLAQGALARTGPANGNTSSYRHPLATLLASGAVQGALASVASAHDATLSQVAIAFLLAEPDVAAVVGASSATQAVDNARAASLRLKPFELQLLRTRFRQLERPLKAVRRLLTLRSVQRADRLRGRVMRFVAKHTG